MISYLNPCLLNNNEHYLAPSALCRQMKAEPIHAATKLSNAMACKGCIVLVERGIVSFGTKASQYLKGSLEGCHAYTSRITAIALQKAMWLRVLCLGIYECMQHMFGALIDFSNAGDECASYRGDWYDCCQQSRRRGLLRPCYASRSPPAGCDLARTSTLHSVQLYLTHSVLSHPLQQLRNSQRVLGADGQA